jgi:hypothetical protein
MKKQLLLVFLAIGLLVSNDLKADTVFYCEEELHTGLFPENGSWITANFNPRRHTIKFSDDYSKLYGLDEKRPYSCSPAYPHAPDQLACLSGYSNGEAFLFNKKAKRFVKTSISLNGGYDINGDDTDSLSAGKCKKF